MRKQLGRSKGQRTVVLSGWRQPSSSKALQGLGSLELQALQRFGFRVSGLGYRV